MCGDRADEVCWYQAVSLALVVSGLDHPLRDMEKPGSGVLGRGGAVGNRA